MNPHITSRNSELKCIKFSEFTPDELIQVLEIRQKVFIIEQTCIYPDIDGFDQDSLHILLFEQSRIVAYARILPSGVRYDIPSFGRFVVDPEERGKGYAHQLIQYTLQKMSELYPQSPIKIQAQVYLGNFYKSYGFKQVSEVYPEDDILHVDMVKE